MTLRDGDSAVFAEESMQAHSQRDPIVVTHDGGKRFVAAVRSHRIVTDQPERAGGGDAGPTPLELLGASLGSCIALYVQQFCLSRDIAFEGMHVEVDQHHASNPHRIGEFVVRVFVPADLDAHQAELLERAARSCPAHYTLAEQTKVTITLHAPAATTTSPDDLIDPAVPVRSVASGFA